MPNQPTTVLVNNTPLSPWVGNVDAATFRLVNCAGVDAPTGVALTFKTNGVTRVYVGATGNVGVGAPLPAYPFVVSTSTGDAQINIAAWGGISVDAAGGCTVGQNIYRTSDGVFRAYANHAAIGGFGWFFGGGVMQARVATGATTAGGALSTTAIVTLLPNGNVGIGRPDPGATVDILGAATSDQLRITNTPSYTYKIGRDTITGYLDFTGTQTGFIGYRFNAGPILFTVPNTAVTDINLVNSMASIWYDEAGNRLVCRVKSSAGVLKTGYVPVA